MALAVRQGGASAGSAPAGGEDGAGPGLMPRDKLRAALKLAARRPVSCVVALTKDRQALHTGNTDPPRVDLDDLQEGLTTTGPQEPTIFDMATPPNVRAAAKGYPGIGATPQGGPTFAGTPYLYPAQPGQKNIVTIQLTGSRRLDFAAANREAGLADVVPAGRDAPDGYTWHHADDLSSTNGQATFELVDSEAHRATLPHSGSVAQYDALNGTRYKR